ncbi:MAG: tripartite tricarboxylate transporter substrate binding protein [Burkholderiaceae bacterium]
MSSLSRRRFVRTGAGAALSLGGWSALPGTALADDAFPSRLINLVVPYPAGGSSDVSARIFAGSFTTTLKQQVVVENIGGGTGVLGANRVLQAPADGYMLFHGSANEIFLAPMLNPAARYRPSDFGYVAPISEATLVLLTRHDLPVRTIDEFIDYAKADPARQLTYGTVGVDSMYHLMGEALALRTRTNLLHVPYKGGAPALQDVAGGQVDFAILPYQTNFQAMQAQQRLRILTSFSRALPAPLADIPLITQSRHVPDFVYTIGGGYFVRKGTPVERLDVLRHAVEVALTTPDIRARLEQEGRHVAKPIRTQAEADQAFADQHQRITSLVRQVGRTILNG